MKFTVQDLDWAVGQGVMGSDVRDRLVVALSERCGNRPALTFANLLYYLGGLIVILSMSFYTTLAWDSLGGMGHLAVAMVYAVVFVAVGNWLWHAKGLRVPGGILITAAVCMTPMAVFGFQELSGLWGFAEPGTYHDFYQWIRSGWAAMEVATVLTGVLALRFYRFPFIAMPVAFALWFISMDLVSMLYGQGFSWTQRAHVSLWFGLAMLVASYAVDRRTREDFAFWGYLFGMAAFWGGLTGLDSNSELGKFLYCMINVGLMGISVLLQRRVFIVFGAMGVMVYLGHLAYTLFKDEVLFSFALSGVGLVIIALGVLYHRRQQRIEAWLLSLIPAMVSRTLPRNRG